MKRTSARQPRLFTATSFQGVSPTEHRVIVRPDQPETTQGKIALVNQKARNTGLVLAAGPGRLLNDGTRVPICCAAGDRVMYAPGQAAEIQLPDGTEALLMEEQSIWAIMPLEATSTKSAA